MKDQQVLKQEIDQLEKNIQKHTNELKSLDPNYHSLK